MKLEAKKKRMRKRDYLTDPRYDVSLVSPREGVRENEDGYTQNGVFRRRYSVYPTLFQNEDGSWVEKSDEDNWGVLKEAINRGEIYNFDSERMAKWFSKKCKKQKGGWFLLLQHPLI